MPIREEVKGKKGKTNSTKKPVLETTGLAVGSESKGMMSDV
jgi:hypothetical protein